MTADFDWPLFLRQLDIREHAWNQRRIEYPRPDAVPFMPYPLPLFAALLIDAVGAVPGWAAYDGEGVAQPIKFLDVGCGPGTKCLLAEALFDLDVEGIDIVPEFVAEARDMGIEAEVCDAFSYPYYGQFHIILVNRPSGLQDQLEGHIRDRMKPGAVLIAINWRNDPERWGWHTVSKEWGEPVRGVWVKPAGIVHLQGPGVSGPARCCGVPAVQLSEHDTLTTDPPLVTCHLGSQQAAAGERPQIVGEVGVVSDDAQPVVVGDPPADAPEGAAQLSG